MRPATWHVLGQQLHRRVSKLILPFVDSHCESQDDIALVSIRGDVQESLGRPMHRRSTDFQTSKGLTTPSFLFCMPTSPRMPLFGIRIYCNNSRCGRALVPSVPWQRSGLLVNSLLHNTLALPCQAVLRPVKLHSESIAM